VSGRWKLLAAAGLLAAILAGCPLRPPAAPPPAAALPQTLASHAGTPYDIVPQASLITILVYRGGTLASAGHNHVIASHDLSGTIYVPADVMRSSFEVHIPVATLTVDEAALRAQQAPADFPPDVSEGAKEGTRHNMLGPALLDAEHNPQIVLQALPLQRPAPAAGAAAAAADSVLARVQCAVRGEVRSFTVPVHYERGEAAVTVSGELALRQTELGLTPFSAMLGALQVQDEMHIGFRIVARAARPAADRN
jgi:YceI-like protein